MWGVTQPGLAIVNLRRYPLAMTFELSPEHEQFRRSVRDFAEKEIAPHAAQWDRDHHFPTEVVQKMGALGLMEIGRAHV